MKIKIVKSAVKNTGKEMNRISEDLITEAGKLEAKYDELAVYWKGKDADKFITNMKGNFLPTLKKLADRMNNYGDYLKQVAEAYDTFDTKQTSKK